MVPYLSNIHVTTRGWESSHLLSIDTTRLACRANECGVRHRNFDKLKEYQTINISLIVRQNISTTYRAKSI